METYEVTFIDLNTQMEMQVLVEADEAETTENIVLKAKLTEQEVVSSNYNYFSAYQEFRDKLLDAGLGIKCNGSRLNAVQSGMMGARDKVYLVEMGKKASMKDVVSLWDYAEITDFPNTNQQLAFFEQWSKF